MMKKQPAKSGSLNNAGITPYIFLIPAFLIFGVFVFLPFIKTILFSFTLTNSAGSPVKFVGFGNYLRLFKNKQFINSVIISFKFALLVGVPSIVVGFVLAVLALRKRKTSSIYETFYALPMAVASAPAAAIWLQLLSPNQSGIINYVLGTDIAWLLRPETALYSIAFVTIWLGSGINFIFLLTGLRNVPDDVIESATIDGAGYFTRLFRILLPIASPQIFFVVFFNITTSFQSFAQVRLLTEGGPQYSTNVLVYSIYQSGIRDGRFETAFAQSVILFLIIFAITLVQLKTEDKVVNY